MCRLFAHIKKKQYLCGKISDPETKDFTGTVVYICEGEMYKIRVYRRTKPL